MKHASESRNIIRRVRARAVAMPLETTIVTPVGVFSHHYAVIATVETGEAAGSYYGWTLSEGEARIFRDMILHVGGGLIGRDAGEIAACLCAMQDSLKLTGRNGVGLFAIGVLDACLWDLKGQQAGMPIWQLLGGSGARPIPCYASSLFLSQDITSLRSEARQFREAGFKWVKMRIGEPDLAEDLRRVEAVRSELGDDIELMMDAVMLFDGRTAIARARAFEQFRPFWIEDPVDYHEGLNLELLAKVRANSPVRIAAGEFQFGALSFRRMIDLQAVDFVMVDLQHVGGLSPWLDVLAMARNAGLPVVPHVFPEMALHVHCIDNSSLPIEYVPWTIKLFRDFPEPEAGAFRPPSRPGLGFTFDWDKVAEWSLGEEKSVGGD